MGPRGTVAAVMVGFSALCAQCSCDDESDAPGSAGDITIRELEDACSEACVRSFQAGCILWASQSVMHECIAFCVNGIECEAWVRYIQCITGGATITCNAEGVPTGPGCEDARTDSLECPPKDAAPYDAGCYAGSKRSCICPDGSYGITACSLVGVWGPCESCV